MNCCSNKCINLVTLIISVIIFIQTNFLTISIFNLKNSRTLETKDNSTNNSINISSTNESDEWRLIIPKININAPIKNGTSEKIINNYIGHFEETAEKDGNIGLVAASAGYKENYFANLKNLVEGDVIIYIKGNDKKEYKITKNIIIEQTDWSYLSNTDENKITLITGILEQTEKRRCVQASEIV